MFYILLVVVVYLGYSIAVRLSIWCIILWVGLRFYLDPVFNSVTGHSEKDNNNKYKWWRHLNEINKFNYVTGLN